MKVLVTGGAGYIGSHTVLLLLEAGHEVLVIDDLTNSSAESLRRVGQIVGREASLIIANVRNEEILESAFSAFCPDSVIHFAGRKAVGESSRIPLVYYRENIGSTIALLEAMERHGCTSLVFSSSATVYGGGEPPFTEDAPTSATNPYGWTKWMIEQILIDVAVATPQLSVGLLRYFNPIGAHPSGMIGEDPHGTPNNLVPFVAQVAAGRREKVFVFGDDYDTPDGTGMRDYIHVIDLAEGHLAALEYLKEHSGHHVWNLGTGRPYSVLQIIHAFEKATGRPIPYEVTDRRPGDVATSFADVHKAREELSWEAKRLSIDEMCADSYRWQSQNPEGYRG